MKMNYDLDLDFDNICRICLTQQEKFVSLFTNQIVDGYIRTMPSIVSYCLDITVNEKDSLPKKLCETCKTTVINYFTFKERCKRTEKVLFESIQKAKQIIGLKIKDENDSDTIDRELCDMGAHEKPGLPAIHLDTIEHLDNDAENEIVSAYDGDFVKQLEDVTELDDPAEVEDPVEVADPTEIDDPGEEDHIADVDDPVELVDSLLGVNETQKTIEFVVDISKDIASKKEFDYLDNLEEHETPEEEHFLVATVDDTFDSTPSVDYFCEICQKDFPKSKYVDHFQNVHFLCSTCLITFESEDEMNEHKRIEHAEQITVQTTSSKKYNNNTLLCNLCNKRWGTAGQLKQHMRLHEALNISMENKFECHECLQCHAVYLKLEDLESHMSLHDGVKSLHTDDAICTDYQFLEEEKPLFLYTCGPCKLTYATMEEMRCHIIIHFNSFSCPFDSCGCEYDTFSRLSLHIVKKHVYGEEHFCTHCRKERFATFDDLQHHIKNNCSAKKFPCDHCEKKFFSKKALQLHIKHAGDKKYKCKHCSKSFAQHGELNIHLRTHTGERPFKCTICSKTYRTASMRAAHMDAHIDGKTFQCTVCSKMLQSRTSYRNHMKRHTLGKSYKCRECARSFYTKYHLDLHTSKIHNKAKGS